MAERNPKTGRFEKGHKKLGGVKVGFVQSLDVRGIVAGAVTVIGGIERLVEWVNKAPENEFAFWTQMYMRLLPLQVHNSGPGAVVLIKPEDLDRAIEERGLPVSMFGRDAPILELTAEADEPEKGNGKDIEGGSDPRHAGNGGEEK